MYAYIIFSVIQGIITLNSNLSSLILVGYSTLASGATISPNSYAAYPAPTPPDGYSYVAINASCTGANNTNVVGLWDSYGGSIIFRNLTSETINTGRLSWFGICVKNT